MNIKLKKSYPLYVHNKHLFQTILKVLINNQKLAYNKLIR